MHSANQQKNSLLIELQRFGRTPNLSRIVKNLKRIEKAWFPVS